MRIATLLSYAGGFKEAVAEVKALEKAGLDVVWVPEAYSFDAPSAMGYIAAETERVTIASGILPIYTRTPSLLAMTAAGIDYLSDGRAMLGLGASGPQVIEGFHGVPYTAPVARTREVIEICRQVWRRERVQHMGDHYQIPLPQDQGTGLGKPLKLINHPVRDEIPIAIASLGPASVAATAELADAWLPAFYTPEAAQAVWGDALSKGNALRDPNRAPLRYLPAAPSPSARAWSIIESEQEPGRRCTSAAWERVPRIFITIFSPRVAMLRRPSKFRICIWLAAKMRPQRRFQKII